MGAKPTGRALGVVLGGSWVLINPMSLGFRVSGLGFRVRVLMTAMISLLRTYFWD